jgi:hypothetical protein
LTRGGELAPNENQILVFPYAYLAPARKPPALKAGLDFRNAVTKRFTALMLRWRKHLGHPHPELAAELSVQLALGFMEQTLLTGRLHAAGEPVPDQRVEQELERALLAYLGVPLGT